MIAASSTEQQMQVINMNNVETLLSIWSKSEVERLGISGLGYTEQEVKVHIWLFTRNLKRSRHLMLLVAKLFLLLLLQTLGSVCHQQFILGRGTCVYTHMV